MKESFFSGAILSGNWMSEDTMLKDRQQMVEDYFDAHGIPVTVRFASGGISIHARTSKTPIARFVPAENGLVEVRWYSHRDKWDHIGDFGGVIMSLDRALEYVLSDAPGCFGIDFL